MQKWQVKPDRCLQAHRIHAHKLVDPTKAPTSEQLLEYERTTLKVWEHVLGRSLPEVSWAPFASIMRPMSMPKDSDEYIKWHAALPQAMPKESEKHQVRLLPLCILILSPCSLMPATCWALR